MKKCLKKVFSFLEKKITISDALSFSNCLEENFKNDEMMTHKIYAFKERDNSIDKESAQFTSDKNATSGDPSYAGRLKKFCENDNRVTADENDFIEVKKGNT